MKAVIDFLLFAGEFLERKLNLKPPEIIFKHNKVLKPSYNSQCDCFSDYFFGFINLKFHYGRCLFAHRTPSWEGNVIVCFARGWKK